MSRYIELHPVNPQARLIDKIVTVIRDSSLVSRLCVYEKDRVFIYS